MKINLLLAFSSSRLHVAAWVCWLGAGLHSISQIVNKIIVASWIDKLQLDHLTWVHQRNRKNDYSYDSQIDCYQSGWLWLKLLRDHCVISNISPLVLTSRVLPTICNQLGQSRWLFRNPKQQQVSVFVPSVDTHCAMPLSHNGMPKLMFIAK